MRIALRRVTKVLLVVLAVVALAGFAVVRLVDVDAWRHDVSRALSDRLGLEVRLTGKMSLGLGRHLGLIVSGIEIRPPGRPGEPPIARVEAVEFEPDLLRSYRERRIVLRQARASGIDISLARDAEGRGNWQIAGAVEQPRPPSTSGVMRVALERIVVEKARLTYATAVSNWAFDLDLHTLDIRVDGPQMNMEVAGLVQGNLFELELESRSSSPESGRLLGPETVLDLELDGHVGPIDISTAGRLARPLGQAEADFAVKLGVNDLGDLEQLVRLPDKIDLVGIGELGVEARLIGGAGSVRLEDVVVHVASQGTGRAEGRGRIGDLIRGADIDLALTVDTPDVEAVARRLRIPTPKARAGKGTGHLRGRWPEVRFEEIVLRADHHRGGSLVVEGDVARVGKSWAANLGFRVDSARVGHVGEIIEEVVDSVRHDQEPIRLGRPELALQQALLAIGPIHATGRVEGIGKKWSITEFSAEAGDPKSDWFRGQGRIASLLPRTTGIEIELEAGSDDLEALSVAAERPIRGLEKLRLHGRAKGDADHLVLTGMQAIATTPESITMGISGDLPIGDSWRDMEALVAVSASDLSVLGEVLGRPLPAVGPLELSAEVHAEGEALVGEDMVVGIGDTVISGDMRVDPGTVRPRVEGALSSEVVYLRDLGLAPSPTDTEGATPAQHAGSWLDRVIPFEDLLEMDGRLSLQIDHLVGRGGLDLEDIELETSVEDGVLHIDDLALAYKGGRVDMSLRVDANAVPPEVGLRFSGDGFEIQRVLAQFVQERVATGIGQLVAHVRGHGHTARMLGASLQGDALFYGREGGLAMRYSRALQIDFGRSAPPGELEQVECLVVDVAAHDGRLQFETILFDTENKQVLGSGQVDLSDEEIDILLTPVLKSALPGSMTAAVRITGPLDDPSITPAPLITASATAQGLVDRALLPLRRVFPGVGLAIDDLRRRADRAIEGTGVQLPDAGLWRPGIDVNCEKVLHIERIEALRTLGDTGDAPSPG